MAISLQIGLKDREERGKNTRKKDSPTDTRILAIRSR